MTCGKVIIEIYCGRTYCGNGYFDTEEEAIAWAESDPFCDKAVMRNFETNEKRTIKMKGKEKKC